MIHAYDKLYLERARTSLACMLDFGVLGLHYDIEEFLWLFISSGVAGLFGAGDCNTIAGKSGIELAYEVLECSGLETKRIKQESTFGRSREYWMGWALAYYQWETALSFSEIIHCVPAADILLLYEPYHEMDIRHFCERMNELIREKQLLSRLAVYRRLAGMSQSKLAEASGVPLRTIQQYEQRQKNINKAQAEYIFRLSAALCCKPENLLEK